MNADNEVTLIEVKFYPEVKSQTSLSSLQVSCKRALKQYFSFQPEHLTLLDFTKIHKKEFFVLMTKVLPLIFIMVMTALLN